MEHEKREKIAVFRFGVIFPLVERDLRAFWGEKERILVELSGKEWEIPYSKRGYISRATILNWLRRYEQGGRKIEALFPEGRSDRGRMRSLEAEAHDALLRLRSEHPQLSTSRLIEIARKEGLLSPEVSAATVYRFFKLKGIEAKKKQEDMRKFEVQMSNDLWQSDCMHGPQILHDGKMRKTYLFAFIDDHSRLIPHGAFYLSEGLDDYLDCLWTAMRRRGLPRKLYVDNGPAFRSHRLQLGCASLEVGLRYAQPYRPQGKGKIERFFRTVRTQFLPEIPQAVSLAELNQLFSIYLENVYHSRVHGSTGQTPIERYLTDAKALRRAPENLPEYFRKQEVRTVAADRTVKLDGRLFESPAGLSGRQVTLRFETYDRVEVFLDDCARGFLTSLNAEANSRTKRTALSEKPALPSGGTLFESCSVQGGHKHG